jgi:hypothetical protein
MRRLHVTWIGPVVPLAALMAAAASQAAPLEAYGRLPSIDKVSLSPDGTRIALVRAVGYERAIGVRSLILHGRASANPYHRRSDFQRAKGSLVEASGEELKLHVFVHYGRTTWY